MFWFFVYLSLIFIANATLYVVGFIPVGLGLEAPAGVFAAGLAFTFRDLVQESLGKRFVIIAILIGAGLSALVTPLIALASGISFLIVELVNTFVYTFLRNKHWAGAIFTSNFCAFIIDSFAFSLLAFGSLAFFGGIMLGKMWMNVFVLMILWSIHTPISSHFWRRPPEKDMLNE